MLCQLFTFMEALGDAAYSDKTVTNFNPQHRFSSALSLSLRKEGNLLWINFEQSSDKFYSMCSSTVGQSGGLTPGTAQDILEGPFEYVSRLKKKKKNQNLELCCLYLSKLLYKVVYRPSGCIF